MSEKLIDDLIAGRDEVLTSTPASDEILLMVGGVLSRIKGSALAAALVTTFVGDAIANGVTDIAPSQNAVYDALALKADLASPALTGTPTAPTAIAGTNTTQLATTAFVTTAINNLINAAPGALDTLDELAAALGDDANFATTVTNALAAKAPLASPTFTGTPAAPTAAPGTNTTQIATTAFVADAIATGGGAYQPLDSDLTSLAALGYTSGTYIIKKTAAATYSLVSISANVESLLGAADYSAMRTQLSLGTAALKNTGTSGNTVPLLDGANTWSAIQTFLTGTKVGAGASATDFIINGNASGSGGGARLTWQNAGAFYAALGNKSAIEGGTFSSVFELYATTDIELHSDTSVLKFNNVAIPTISSSDTLSNKTLSSPTLSGTIAGSPTASGNWTFSGTSITLQAANPRVFIANTAGTAATVAVGADSASGWIGTTTNSQFSIYTNSTLKINFDTSGNASVESGALQLKSATQGIIWYDGSGNYRWIGGTRSDVTGNVNDWVLYNSSFGTALQAKHSTGELIGASTGPTSVYSIGYRGIPRRAQVTASTTLVLEDAGQYLEVTMGAGSQTVTIPPNSSVAFPLGTVVTIVGMAGSSTFTVIEGSGVTLRRGDGTASSGTRTVTQYSTVVLHKVDTNVWQITGAFT